MIVFSNVQKWYGSYHALRNINAEVRSGEVVVLLGPSGSGKSTLIRTVNRLETVQEGRILFDGVAVTSGTALDINGLRSRIGFVFQQFNLFPHLSALDNVTLAPIHVKGLKRPQARDLALQLLDRVGMRHKADSFPAQLSGGQQQRVAIARSLAMQPQVMLFDEITSALDPELVGEVLKVLEEMARDGMTMMLVTHEIGFARKVANRVVFMHEGRIWEEGPAAATLARPRTPELETFLSAVLH